MRLILLNCCVDMLIYLYKLCDKISHGVCILKLPHQYRILIFVHLGVVVTESAITDVL